MTVEAEEEEEEEEEEAGQAFLLSFETLSPLALTRPNVPRPARLRLPQLLASGWQRPRQLRQPYSPPDFRRWLHGCLRAHHSGYDQRQPRLCEHFSPRPRWRLRSFLKAELPEPAVGGGQLAGEACRCASGV